MKIIYYKNINELRETEEEFKTRTQNEMITSKTLTGGDSVLFVFNGYRTEICALPLG